MPASNKSLSKCRKCNGHGIPVAVKGHASECPFRYCNCRKCQKVVSRRISSTKNRLKEKSSFVFIKMKCLTGNVRIHAVKKSEIESIKSEKIISVLDSISEHSEDNTVSRKESSPEQAPQKEICNEVSEKRILDEAPKEQTSSEILQKELLKDVLQKLSLTSLPQENVPNEAKEPLTVNIPVLSTPTPSNFSIFNSSQLSAFTPISSPATDYSRVTPTIDHLKRLPDPLTSYTFPNQSIIPMNYDLSTTFQNPSQLLENQLQYLFRHSLENPFQNQLQYQFNLQPQYPFHSLSHLFNPARSNLYIM